MQRPKTDNTRLEIAPEKRFKIWTKQESCCICWCPGPGIVDHCEGSTFRHNKVLIGMWFLLPYCYEHDLVKTQGGRAAHFKAFGFNQSQLWLVKIDSYPSKDEIPLEVIQSIRSWNR